MDVEREARCAVERGEAAFIGGGFLRLLINKEGEKVRNGGKERTEGKDKKKVKEELKVRLVGKVGEGVRKQWERREGGGCRLLNKGREDGTAV